MRPSTYVFDAYGTLLDVHAAVNRHAMALGPEARRLSEMWRSKQLEYAFVRGLSGRYRDFWTLTEAALDHAGACIGGLAPDLRDKLLQAYRSLDAYQDVAPALTRLRQQGCRIAILSNGTPAMLSEALAAASLTDLIDLCLSVDALQTFKTDPRVYAYALAQCGGAVDTIGFVSSNRWDVAGASAFGLTTTWLNRGGLPDEYADLPPHAVIATLEDLGRT